ncbi:MAG: HAD family hydrolase [Anaerolineae bacterium]|nr:MAG: HAD family hydrolase [Anaerolineae bacterium]
MPLDISRIKALCFDVDGTLSDTDDQYAARFARLLSPFTAILPHRDPNKAARWLVMAMESPANRLFGLPDRLGLDDELHRLGEWLHRERPSNHHFQLIDGIQAALETLRPYYPMTIVTARGPRGTDAFLQQFHLRQYFAGVASSQTTPRTKPYPDPILWSAAQTNVDPHECLMIGDTTVDIRAGRAAGSQTVGVLSGFGEESELIAAGADAILPSVAELPHLLAK